MWEEWVTCLISSSKWAHWRTEARPQEYRPGLSMPQTGVWGLSFCPLTSSPAVSTHSTPADGVDSTLLVIATFSLQVSFLTLCSLWRSPSSPACVIGLRDLLSLVVSAGLLPASLAKGRTVQLPWRPFVHIWLSSGDTQPVSSKNQSPAFLQPSLKSPYSPLIAVCSFLSLQMSSRSDGLWAPCWGKSLRPALASAVLLHSTVSSSWSWCVVVCFLVLTLEESLFQMWQNRPLYFSLLSSIQLAA